MFDLENTNYDNNKNVDVTTEVAYRKEGISNDNTNKEADSVYGVIYVPGENGPEYVSKHYNISDISDKNLAESKTDITKQSKKNSLRRALALTAVVLAFTVLISSSFVESCILLWMKWSKSILVKAFSLASLLIFVPVISNKILDKPEANLLIG